MNWRDVDWSTLPTSRKEAKEKGSKFYYTGKLCKNGHDCPRYSSGPCPLCLHERAQRPEVKEKTAETARKNQTWREWRKKNRERHTEYMKRYRQENKEAIAKKRAEYNRDNKEKIAAYNRWHMENRYELHVKKNQKRRAMRVNARPEWFDEFDEFVFEEAYDLARLRGELLGGTWHIDHMIPLQAEEACGLDVGCNIQVVPSEFNLWKGNRMVGTEPNSWMKEMQNVCS